MALTQEEWMIYAYKEGCKVANNAPVSDIKTLANARFRDMPEARDAFIAGYLGILRKKKEKK